LPAVFFGACSTPDLGADIGNPVLKGARAIGDVPVRMVESVPKLQHKLFCGTMRLRSHHWTAQQFASIDRKVLRGELQLESGRKLPWRSTVYVPTAGWNGRVLWYFHGFCGTGEFGTGGAVDGSWKIYDGFGERKPVVVGFSLGDDWLLNEELRSEVWLALTSLQSGLNLPEHGHDLFGFSMGGFNALSLYGDPHPSIVFDRCVVVAPCIPDCDPYAPRGELENYYRQPPGKRILKRSSVRLVREFFPEPDRWELANPVGHPQRFAAKPLLVLAGEQDGFGFQTAAREFASTTAARFVSFAGAHVIPSDPEAVAAILRFLDTPP
jgi:hypothetical protein